MFQGNRSTMDCLHLGQPETLSTDSYANLMDFITTKFYSEKFHTKISNKTSEISIKKALSV